MRRAACLYVLLLLSVSARVDAQSLEIVSAGPVGQLDNLARASEIRITFSEPMIAVGKTPPVVTIPFLRIEPVISGTFRWAGTSTLVFTPSRPLPFSTTYRVTAATTAKSVSGQTLASPYSFSFTTPRMSIVGTQSYRKNGKSTDPLVIGLSFNQPVNRAEILKSLKLRYLAFTAEGLPAPPAAETPDQALTTKLSAARAASSRTGRVLAFVAEKWNTEVIPDLKEVLVVETQPGIPAGTRIEAILERSAQESISPGEEANQIQVDPILFVRNLSCKTGCDPESYNALTFTSPVLTRDLARHLTVEDVTVPDKPQKLVAKKVGEDENYPQTEIGLDSLGYSVRPARSYRLTIAPGLTGADGQILGYTWRGTLENWHLLAFSSFGEGDGVWESSGGGVLPFYARNLKSVDQQIVKLSEETLFPTILALRENPAGRAKGPAKSRLLRGETDKIESHGLDASPSLGKDNRGLLRLTLSNEKPIARARTSRDEPRSSVVQFTNLGISVKYSRHNILVFVTTLDDARPVGEVQVRLRTRDNKVRIEGRTAANGLFLAPMPANVKLDEPWNVQFLVTASLDSDFAYVASNWNEGLYPWEFEIEGSSDDPPTTFRASLFTDRGIYKRGEEVRVKSIVRADTPTGMQLLPSGRSVTFRVLDVRNNEVVKRTLKLSEWSSVDWAFTLESDAVLGDYTITASVEGVENVGSTQFITGAYRRPQFRVDTNLSATEPVAGNALRGSVSSRYLSGTPLRNQKASLGLTRQLVFDIPTAIRNRFPEERFQFGGMPERYEEEDNPFEKVVVRNEQKPLNNDGTLDIDVATSAEDGLAYAWTLEAEVADVSRQRIASRSSLVIHPAPFYAGVSELPYFVTTRSISPSIVAVALNGTVVSGIKVDARLMRIQWNSVRRAEGNAFYTWESERKVVEAGQWSLTTGPAPQPLPIALEEGGQYELRLSASDAAGHRTITTVNFFVVADGYTAWMRHDHNRIDLVPEKKRYSPGDTARIMIRSPWEKATALVTKEREGVRTQHQFQLDSTQETIEVPIEESDVPNVFVSVLLVKGRSGAATKEDTSDPGKPAFRLGYTALQIEDSGRRLNVNVKANKAEYRPGGKAEVSVAVTDQQKRAVRSEVTLWAVDYGVLSLTGYREPDVVADIYVPKPLSVMNADSRQRLISRRVITPKGASEGGGGGRDVGSAAVRKDFRPLAFWLGSLVTDASGRLSTSVTLPDSLTTYRIMAVAADQQSRFGRGRTEMRTDKPVQLRSAFPRFLTVGDRAEFGSVIANQSRASGRAIVSIQSLDPAVLNIENEAARSLDAAAGSTTEVRFRVRAVSAGVARVRMTAKLGDETDVFEDTIPVRLFSTPETVATVGRTTDRAVEQLAVPQNVVAGVGGLDLEIASTSLAGLAESARYLVTYPYGCAEQRASAVLGLMLPAELGTAYPLPDVDAAGLRKLAQKTIDEFQTFATDDGGFAYWAGQTQPDPYVTAWLVHVLHTAKGLKYSVNAAMLERAHGYLANALISDQTPLATLRPYELARRAFVLKVLAEGKALDDSQLNRYYDAHMRMPLFAVAFLDDALTAKGQKGPRHQKLQQRLTNAVLPEAATAHIDEWNDAELQWLWSSNVRTTAIALSSMIRNSDENVLVHPMVRWLLQRRVNGRWDDTQENAWAMLALIDYSRKFAREKPAFDATVTAGPKSLMSKRFEGVSLTAMRESVTLAELRTMIGTAETPLTFAKSGEGTLHYTARLSYAIDPPSITSLSRGFEMTRSYAASEGTPSAGRFAAGSLVRVTLKVSTTKERSFVAITDPIPAGFELVDAALATTASAPTGNPQDNELIYFDHIERHDDRIDLFANRLPPGTHTFTYLVRATTAGTFRTPPARASQMYEPEVFGRTSSVVIEILP